MTPLNSKIVKQANTIYNKKTREGKEIKLRKEKKNLKDTLIFQ